MDNSLGVYRCFVDVIELAANNSHYDNHFLKLINDIYGLYNVQYRPNQELIYLDIELKEIVCKVRFGYIHVSKVTYGLFSVCIVNDDASKGIDGFNFMENSPYNILKVIEVLK